MSTLKVGLPISKLHIDPTKKWTSDLNSLVKVISKIQNVRSVGVMKLFLWPFENGRFRYET